MRLRTRLYITFVLMIILPIFFISIAFAIVFLFGNEMNRQVSFGVYGVLIGIVTPLLCLKSYILSRWIHKGIFYPVRVLNKAMQQIEKGDLDHSIQSNTRGELGDLHQMYEAMRIRLKESAEEKQENEQYNRELISNISHDLKTPITAIKGYSEGLIDGVADTPEKKDKYIRTIYNKARDMDQLINELRLYSKIDNNNVVYNFCTLNISAYFSDCVEELMLDLEDQEVELHYVNVLPKDTMIYADPEQLKRVINNILGNSLKYMNKAKGIITIQLYEEDNDINITIQDNGIGVAAEDLSKIFERFYRTDASRNSSRGGTGIGLSIVRKIMEDHGGYIWATSQIGEGTCMHLVVKKHDENEDEKQKGG
ncbi:MAG: HAMP domain-containing sensor histidine kinase [Eubacteriales bacterium]